MSNDLDVVLDAAIIIQSTALPAKEVRGISRPIQIVLLGDGKEKVALQRRASEMGLTNLTFLPSIPKHEMPTVLAGTDACIAILKRLDEYKTTYPNKVFDYMAAGRPVVLVIDGVIRRVVETAKCGLFVEPGNANALANAICRLASEPEKSRAMGLNGRIYLEENFSREKIAEKLVNLCENLVRP